MRLASVIEPRFALHIRGAAPTPLNWTVGFVHGGQRWRCGDTTAEVAWGMWGLESFGERDRCRTELAGVPVMVARRSDKGASVLVWYLTGRVHEPIVSAFSGKSTDRERVEAIAHSGEVTGPRR
jgi:hypothetical protein